MSKNIEINQRQIGPGLPVYVVAEISANHNGSFDQAVAIIEAARSAGADAVKLQTYTPDTITIRSDEECFRVGGGTLWDGRSLHDLYNEAYTPWDWQPKLKEKANALGLDLFSSPFDNSSVDFLEQMDVPAYKIASFEIVDLPLIRHVASTGKPVIISTGMASLEEIDEAVRTFHGAGGRQLALLKCTSAYPAPPEEMNLRTIAHLAQTYGLPVGLSDHTLGITVPVVAVALGATIVEKHITLSRSTIGPDSAFSLEPQEFKEMIVAIRDVEKAMGMVSYGAGPTEFKSRSFRRSLFVVRAIKSGEEFTRDNVRSIRPGHGLHTRHLDDVVGKRATRNINVGTPLSWSLVADA